MTVVSPEGIPASSARDPLDAHALLERYRTGLTTPKAVVADVLHRIGTGDPGVFLDRVDPVALEERVAELEAIPGGAEHLPLYGLPFAVKDNIEVAGRPTTAACPAYTRIADRTATAVRLLEEAGAILVGKTNLDQFATGLVGTRTPYGVPRNPRAPQHVPGGSSSGSAVAVASRLVSFTLGTDTAGSGRVPAAMTGIVGLKPTRGLVSTSGVLPACPSLDCVSVFAGAVRDAALVADVLDRSDPDDPWSRRPGERTRRPADEVRALRIGVPTLDRLEPDIARAFAGNVRQLAAIGLQVVDVDFEPFERTGRLLYEGPWIAERLAAVRSLLDGDDGLLPVVAEVLDGGRRWSAEETFTALGQLASLRRRVEGVFADVDLIVVPSVPTLPTLGDVAQNPIATNAALGRFTNFVNLLDLAAVAVPAGEIDGVPVGVTLIGPALTDRTLLAVAAAYVGEELHEQLPAVPMTELVVVGAHLRGQPLHHELVAVGARLVERTTTAASYRLYHLGGSITKPGLVRSAGRTGAVEVEVYELPVTAVAMIRERTRAPLAIEAIELLDGRWIDGFVCAADGVEGAVEITEFGGWRPYLSAARRA